MQTWKCIKSKKFEREMKVSKCIEAIFVWKKGGEDDVCINNNEIKKVLNLNIVCSDNSERTNIKWIKTIFFFLWLVGNCLTAADFFSDLQ